MTDDATMMWDEVADIGSLLSEFGPAEFDTPSLCAGWRVRDVLGHMALGHTTPLPRMLATVARHGFKVPKASLVESRKRFEGATPDEIRAFWQTVMVAQHPRKGITKMIPTKTGFLDHLVHNQDIRQPTGRPRHIPEERLRRALELVRSEGNGFLNPKKNLAGLTVRATDIDFSAGEGPVVEGTAEAIVMAATGRTVAAADLSGDGAPVLRQRIGA
ncbi:MAG TPA: maleylpyruvate isomerase family mycothiol-dependent enzyme [Acidimicrobiales bacterium]|nr:maleylpyruvate isomerase family mycothiol-dependent enzyme [Acidimicrobiales bacterium]